MISNVSFSIAHLVILIKEKSLGNKGALLNKINGRICFFGGAALGLVQWRFTEFCHSV